MRVTFDHGVHKYTIYIYITPSLPSNEARAAQTFWGSGGKFPYGPLPPQKNKTL